MNLFPTDIRAIEDRIQAIDPIGYGNTRNFKDGAVTRLSPYLSRGVISTKQVYEHIKSLGLPWHQCEKLIQELAWRDYWQLVWHAKGEGIKQDLKHKQEFILNYQIPDAIVHANTGVNAVDMAIKELYATGYMHNHMRMYVASICCNIANSHWLEPARWLYANLLDGDLASNHLSWQWVAGSFSNKKYYANQWNINKFFGDNQQDTFLDVEYEDFDRIELPSHFESTSPFNLKTILPSIEAQSFDSRQTTLIYNYYNIDPQWYKEQDVQRVFLIEPSFYAANPVSQKCLDFALALTKNIQGIRVFVGEFSELSQLIGPDVVFKEHPSNTNYKGRQESREWISNINGYYASFFAFWRKCKNEIKYESE